MLFEWDNHKAALNELKHGVSFELAQSVFDDPLHLSVLELKNVHEERWVTLGLAADSKTLVVVHTYKSVGHGIEIIRIISARPATKKERKQYEEGI